MFEFYFVEEFFGKTSTWVDVLLVIIPVLTLVLGFFLNRWTSHADKRKKDRKTTEDLLTEIELLGDPMKNQIRAVDDFIEVLKRPRLEQGDFTAIYSLKMDRVSILNRSGVVDHLERVFGDRRKAIEKANDLFLGCDVLTVRHEQLHEVVGHFIAEAQQLFEQWRLAANALLMAVSDQMVEIEREHKSPAEDPLIGQVLLLTHVRDFMKGDVFEQFKKVHEPLMEVLAKHRTDLRVNELGKLNSAVVKAAMALQREREYAISKLGKIKEGISKRYEKLKEAANSIRSEG